MMAWRVRFWLTVWAFGLWLGDVARARLLALGATIAMRRSNAD